jgi:DUF1009 family protein
MLIKNLELAIIAGKGDLVSSCIEECKKRKISTLLIAITGFYDDKKNKPDISISLNKIGNIFSILKKYKVKKILFIGAIQKPQIYNLRPDFLTIYYITLIILNYFKGDNNLLTKIYNIFINKGFTVLDIRKLLKQNIADNIRNNLNLFNDKINLQQISYYFSLAKAYGIEDKGQAILVSNNKVILKENKKGTDDLINRYKLLKKKYEFTLLVKTSKPNQNLYLDLPTIGPNTIIAMKTVGINGVILEKNKSLIAKPNETFNLIKEHNLFYYAV